ncbi:MAG: hypothetical protein ACKOB5_02110, partial [Betaproteobacteria bacterium]
MFRIAHLATLLACVFGATGLALGAQDAPTAAGRELRLSADAVEPEAASGWTPRAGWAGSRHMV